MSRESAAVTLPATLDPPGIDRMLSDLRAVRGQPVALAAGGVARPTTPGLQALLSAAMTWRTDGYDFDLASASPALRDAWKLLGLPEAFLSGDGVLA
jgi:chemotaxis protein CheX